MISDPLFYAAALPAIIAIGLAKGGLGTIGMLAVPILSIVISPVQAAGILLPVLVASDVIAVYSYRDAIDRRTLTIMMPGAMAGILVGWLTAAWVSEDLIRLIVGLVSILFALNQWLPGRTQSAPAEHNAPRANLWGAFCGFTSFVSHSGAPPFQMYVAPLRLEPRLFAGTFAVMFAIINAVKLVPFFFLGQFDTTNLATAAVLAVIVVPSTLAGVWLVNRIEKNTFYRIVYVLMFLLGLYLVAAAIAGMTSG